MLLVIKAGFLRRSSLAGNLLQVDGCDDDGGGRGGRRDVLYLVHEIRASIVNLRAHPIWTMPSLTDETSIWGVWEIAAALWSAGGGGGSGGGGGGAS